MENMTKIINIQAEKPVLVEPKTHEDSFQGRQYVVSNVDGNKRRCVGRTTFVAKSHSSTVSL